MPNLFVPISAIPIRVLNMIGFAPNDLAWIAAGLALVSLVISLVALRRARQSPETDLSPVIAAPSESAAPAASASDHDPALIAVITAAVAMMLAESQTTGLIPGLADGPKAIAASPAGFTIRQVRRV